jgi:hemolysin III
MNSNQQSSDDESGAAPSDVRLHDLSSMRSLSDVPSGTQANAHNRKHNVREYTLGEEIANSITHGIGVLLAIAALVLVIIAAVNDGGGIKLFAALVYGVTMILEYLMSTLYHAIAVDRAKRVFKILDHSCIYLFIAGSYTPFCLDLLQDCGGIPLCIFVWVVAIVGVAFESFWNFRPRWVSAVLYLLMGWAVIWFINPLIAALPTTGLILLVGGGICYSIGCIFYVLKKVPYMHSIFHLWVLAGSVCQFLAILWYAL